MTLVLTAATPYFIIQVADRLVSLCRGKVLWPADPIANKTIVYRAIDAVLTIAYAGSAYIDDVPTDELFAERLWGAPLYPKGEVPALCLGRTRNLWCYSDVVRNLEEVIRSRAPIAQPIAVVVAGWRQKGKRVHAVGVRLEKRSGSSEVRRTRGMREWAKNKMLCVHGIGADVRLSYLAEAFDAERRTNEFLGPQEIENILVATIRRISAETAGVGTNLLSVFLPRPGRGSGYSKFLPTASHPLRLDYSPSETVVLPDSAHTPWVVCHDQLRPPSALVGGRVPIDMGGYSFDLIGAPSPPGPRVVAAVCGVRRPSRQALGRIPQPVTKST